jgi:hypothetical protein
MRIAAFAAALLALAPSLGQARITPPLGRSPKPPPRGQQKLWEDGDGQFAIKRPEGNRWSFQGKARGPDGQQVPLFASAQESGAQLVVQSAEGINDLKTLTKMLNDNLSKQETVRVEDIEPLLARGGDAFGFKFSVAQDTRGRVAVVRTGQHVALVIASWPFGTSPEVVDDVEAMIGSLGPIPGSLGAF